MKAKLGIFFMVIGIMLLAGALCLFIYNEHQQAEAGKASQLVMPQLVEAINLRREEGTAADYINFIPGSPQAENMEMAVALVEDKGYIGFVSLPALGLELPVVAEWNYDDLSKSPCRYSGSIYSDDMVIMAHNYDKHFGRIANLKAGDEVAFTDVNGETISYEVVATDVLASTDVENMKAGEFDLTLFTCDYSGNSRITIRCDRIK